MSNLSETQTLLIQLVGEVKSVKETVNQIREDTKTYPITKAEVEKHAEHHKIHFSNISRLERETSRAKGWAAGLGAVAGLVVEFFRK